ncbi:MAG: hypothetical protein LBM96_11565 [Methanobrevibacter sp.]|jgi:hypothetical protein|nr:hypothetical protein [Candidatus Methanoflexus mossambicus]
MINISQKKIELSITLLVIVKNKMLPLNLIDLIENNEFNIPNIKISMKNT